MIVQREASVLLAPLHRHMVEKQWRGSKLKDGLPVKLSLIEGSVISRRESKWQLPDCLQSEK